MELFTIIEKPDFRKVYFLKLLDEEGNWMQELANHEKLELHEYLTFKNVCATKSMAMSKLAKDSGLKALLDDDLRITGRQIQEVSQLLANTIH